MTPPSLSSPSLLTGVATPTVTALFDCLCFCLYLTSGFLLVNREVKAGTELTWNYCDNVLTASLQKQEMQCLCRSNNCQGQYIVEENLCDLCDIKGHTDTEA